MDYDTTKMTPEEKAKARKELAEKRAEIRRDVERLNWMEKNLKMMAKKLGVELK